MKHRPWSPEQDAILAELYKQFHRGEIAARMGRTPAAIKCRVSALGLKKPEGATNAGHFVRGESPWNKGQPFTSGGRSTETQFKPGQKPHTWNQIGHERVTKDGYRQRKMTDTGVTRRDYVFLHHLLWVEHHGPVPDGCAIVFRNGDKADIRIDNLECISRRELMLRNSFHTNYPPEVRKLVQLRGAITRQINKRGKQA